MAVLSACGMAVAHQADCARVLGDAAANDPLLGKAARPIIAALERGEALSTALRRGRILSPCEARLLAAAEGSGASAELLPLLVHSRELGPPGMLLWRLLPLWLMLTLVGFGVVIHHLIRLFGTHYAGEIYDALAITLPLVPHLALRSSPFEALLVVVIALTPLLLLMACARLPALALRLRVLLGCALEQPYLIRELLLWGRIAEVATAQGQSLPQSNWQRQWQAYFLSLYLTRLPSRQLRENLAQLDPGDLLGHLQTVGILPPGRNSDNHVVWSAALKDATLRQQEVYRRIRPYVMLTLLGAAFMAFMNSTLFPLMQLVSWLG